MRDAADLQVREGANKMKKSYLVIVVVGLTTLLLAACSTDSKVESKPSVDESVSDKAGIISTTVAMTEILDALDVDLIGVPSTYKTLPKRYDDLPEVGSPMNPDMEVIMSLKPQEVLSV